MPFPIDDIEGVVSVVGYSITDYESVEACRQAIDDAFAAYQNGEGPEPEVIYELVPVDRNTMYIIYSRDRD